jgi:serine/threonine protein kinase
VDPDAPLQLHIGQVLARDYRVVRALAAGGMGSVYLVEQLSTGKQRALKVMHPQYARDEESRARFAQEARAGARIKSEHVVEVVAAGVDDETGIPWLAMELLDGEELSLRMRRTGRLPPSEVLEIFRQLGHGLGEAHRQGLVHRDLKPENLFIAVARSRSAPFTLKILDFGVAKLTQETMTAAQSAGTRPIGTPRWMAPEQSEEHAHIAPATDVWALGLIAFYLLTGRLYWRAANSSTSSMTTLLRELILDPIDLPSIRAAALGADGAIPRGFDEWFLRCVNRDAKARFANADEALTALVPLLENAPTWVPPAQPKATALPSAQESGDGATVGQGAFENARVSTLSNRANLGAPLPSTGTVPFGTEDATRPAQPNLQPVSRVPAQVPPPIALPLSLPAVSSETTPARPASIANTPASQGASPQLAKPEIGAATAPLAVERAPGAKTPLFAGVAAGVIVLALIASFALRSKPSALLPVAPPAPAPIAQPAAPPKLAAPDSFTYVIESIPSGAAVMEGDKSLGETPLQLTMDNQSLRTQPRHFRIVKEGYTPYSVIQGPSFETVKIIETLGEQATDDKPEEPRPQKPRHRDEPGQDEPELRLKR